MMRAEYLCTSNRLLLSASTLVFIHIYCVFSHFIYCMHITIRFSVFLFTVTVSGVVVPNTFSISNVNSLNKDVWEPLISCVLSLSALISSRITEEEETSATFLSQCRIFLKVQSTVLFCALKQEDVDKYKATQPLCWKSRLNSLLDQCSVKKLNWSNVQTGSIDKCKQLVTKLLFAL